MNKEQIYDEQISPLMTQIIKICQDHEIDFIANFELGPVDEGRDPEEQATSCHTFLNFNNHLRIIFMDYARQANENGDALIIGLVKHARLYGNHSSAYLEILGVPHGTIGT